MAFSETLVNSLSKIGHSQPKNNSKQCNFHSYYRLTHWGRVTHICVSKPTIIGSDNGLSPGRSSSHYPDQCRNIVNLTLRNKLQWNFNRYSSIFIQENPLENVVWKMAAILCRPQCVNVMGTSWEIAHVSATEPIDDKSTLVQVLTWCGAVTQRTSTRGSVEPDWSTVKSLI